MAAEATPLSILRISCQASSEHEHFQQCTKFSLLCNRGLGPLAVTVLPIPLASRAAATACAAVHGVAPRMCGKRLDEWADWVLRTVQRCSAPSTAARDGDLLSAPAVGMDVAELSHKPNAPRSPAGDRPITAALQAELTKAEALAAGHRGGL
jgi:hypothetical protein